MWISWTNTDLTGSPGTAQRQERRTCTARRPPKLPRNRKVAPPRVPLHREGREPLSLLAAHLLDDGIGDLAHREAAIHRGLLDPTERLGFGKPHTGFQ